MLEQTPARESIRDMLLGAPLPDGGNRERVGFGRLMSGDPDDFPAGHGQRFGRDPANSLRSACDDDSIGS